MLFAEVTVDFKLVHAKCNVIFGEDISADELKKDVPDRFYFLEVINISSLELKIKDAFDFKWPT